jgi:hypothetical protein
MAVSHFGESGFPTSNFRFFPIFFFCGQSIISETEGEAVPNFLSKPVHPQGKPNSAKGGPPVQTMDAMLKIKRSKVSQAEQVLPGKLAEFQGVYVWVSQVDAALAADGLDRERLWFEAQKQILGAGLPAPNRSWQQTPLFPCLGVLIHADQAQVTPPFYVFSVEVFFVQQITLMGNPATNAMRMNWCREAIGDARYHLGGYDWSNLYTTVSFLIGQFLEEYVGVKAPATAERLRVQ